MSRHDLGFAQALSLRERDGAKRQGEGRQAAVGHPLPEGPEGVGFLLLLECGSTMVSLFT
jgi:hypothetical protein